MGGGGGEFINVFYLFIIKTNQSSIKEQGKIIRRGL